MKLRFVYIAILVLSVFTIAADLFVTAELEIGPAYAIGVCFILFANAIRLSFTNLNCPVWMEYFLNAATVAIAVGNFFVLFYLWFGYAFSGGSIPAVWYFATFLNTAAFGFPFIDIFKKLTVQNPANEN